MLRRVKSLNFSVSGESLPAEATKQKWRLKLRPAMSMTLNTPLASSSLTENTDTIPMLRLWRRKALMASVLPRRMRMYGAQNEAYMSRSAEKWVRGLCFNELGVCG